MLDDLRKTIAESRIRRSCGIGIILLGLAELARRTMLPTEWPGQEALTIVLGVSALGLTFIVVFPTSLLLRHLPYGVFFSAACLFGIGQIVWEVIRVLFKNVRTPPWLFAANAILILVMIGSLLSGEVAPKYRSPTAIAIVIIVVAAILAYFFL